MKTALLLLLVFCCAFASARIQPIETLPGLIPTSSTTYTPSWSHLASSFGDFGTIITIDGCGFNRYESAVCVFGLEFTSSFSAILSDTRIICEVPRIENPSSYFETLPQYVRLDLVFDSYDTQCTDNSYLGPFRFGPQLDCTDPIIPEHGAKSGNEDVTIIGEGFTDSVLLDLQVRFGSTTILSATVVNDTHISVKSPLAKSLYEKAMISLHWTLADDNSTEVYLHSTVPFQYGPVFDAVSPSCGLPWRGQTGSDKITITGQHFAGASYTVEQSASSSTLPAGNVLILLTPNVPISWNTTTNPIQSGSPLQVIGEIIGNSITFQAPDFFKFVTTPNVPLMNTLRVSIEIYWNQVGDYSAVPFSYSQGLSINNVLTDDKTEQFHWHSGGGDLFCFHGCGLNLWNVYGSNITVSGASLPPTQLAVQSGGLTACFTTPAICSVSEDLSDVVWTVNNASPIVFTGFNDTVEIGPRFVDNRASRGPEIVTAASASQLGKRLCYTAACGTNGGWATSSDLMSQFLSSRNPFTQPAAFNTSAQNYVSIAADNEITFSWAANAAQYAEGWTTVVNFRTGSSICKSETHTHRFAPICQVTTINTAINGGGIVEVSTDLETGPAVMARVADNTVDPDSVPTDSVLRTRNDSPNFDSIPCSRNSGAVSFQTLPFRLADGLKTGRRLWGQRFTVELFFNYLEDTYVENLLTAVYTHPIPNFTAATSSAGLCGPCQSYASLACGDFRFGPITHSFSPCQGPIGPSATDVDFNATVVSDAWDTNAPSGISGVNIGVQPYDWVAFGSLFGHVNKDLSKLKSTAAGGVWSNPAQQTSVAAFFDVCNITQVPNFVVVWGPVLGNLSTVSGSEDGISQDFYGFAPSEFLDQGDNINPLVTIHGVGFSEWGPSKITVIVDGVHISPSNVADTEIAFTPPVRPFGTAASVVVQFGDIFTNEMAPSNKNIWSPSAEVSDPVYRLEATGILWYTPKITSLPIANGKTSGGTAISVSCLGCGLAGAALFDWGQFNPTLWVDGYQADLPLNVLSSFDGVYLTNTPSQRGVFNTKVPVALTFRKSVPTTNNVLCSPPLFLVASDFDFHYGPVCSGLAPATHSLIGTFPDYGSTLLGTTDGKFESPQLNWFVVVANNDDCDVSPDFSGDDSANQDDAPSFNYGNASFPGAEQPQKPASVQYPFNPTGNYSSSFKGTRTCAHRRAIVTVVGSTAPLNPSADTLDEWAPADNDSSQLRINIPRPANNSIACKAIKLMITYPDAVIAEDGENTIECPFSIHYGPIYTGLSAHYIYTVGSDDVAYGWGYGGNGEVTPPNSGGSPMLDGRVTITGARFGDDLLDDYYSPSLIWRREQFSTTVSAFQSTDVAIVSVVPSISSIMDISSPRVTVEAIWNVKSGIPGGLASGICQSALFKFHYGPELLGTSRDDCTAASSVNLETDYGSQSNVVVISGRALGCCGYDQTPQTNGLVNTTRCWLPSTYFPQAQFQPTASFLSGTSFIARDTPETITCRVPIFAPPGITSLDYRYMGFGLSTYSAVPTTPTDGNFSSTSTGTTNNQNPFNRRFLKSSFSICYGPTVSPQTFESRFSGFQDQVTRSSPEVVGGSEMTFPVQIGDAFGYVSEVTDQTKVCTFDFESPHLNQFNATDPLVDYSANIRTCPSPVFGKFCFQSADARMATFTTTQRVEWTQPNGGLKTLNWTPMSWTGPTTSAVPEFVFSPGSPIKHTVTYGPKAEYDPTPSVIGSISSTALCPGSTSETCQYRRVFTNQEPRTTDQQFATINVKLSHYWDWVSSVTTPIWGSEKYMCLFGSLSASAENDEFLLRERISTQFWNESAFSYSFGVGADAGTFDLFGLPTGTTPGPQTISCEVPPSPFGTSGSLYVLLDPHVDGWTSLYNPTQVSNVNSDRLGWWFWTPYAALADSWVPLSAPSATLPLTIYGLNFDTYYDRVLCSFLDSSSPSSSPGTILTDSMVVCHVPSFSTPQAALTVSLTFGTDANTCPFAFSQCGDRNTVTSARIMVAGVSKFTPTHGPTKGNTIVMLEQVGLDRFNSVDCVWSVGGSIAAINSEGAWSCVSPAVSSPQIVTLSIRGFYSSFFGLASNSSFETILGETCFDFGAAAIDTVSPQSKLISQNNLMNVTVTGYYFNGGMDSGTYSCVWALGNNPASDIPRELGASVSFANSVSVSAERIPRIVDGYTTYDLRCTTPAFVQIASYPFKIIFDGSDSTNVVHYDITSPTPIISGILTNFSGNEMSEFTLPVITDYEIAASLITISGSNFFGGRVAQETPERSSAYLVKFGQYNINSNTSFLYGTIEIQVATFDVDSNEIIVVAAVRPITPHLSDFDDQEETDTLATAAVPLSVSIDGGYTWSAPVDITYFQDITAAECLNSASSVIFSFTIFVFTLLYVSVI